MGDRIKVRDGDLRKPVFSTEAKVARRDLSRVDGPLRERTRQRFTSLLAPRQLEHFVPKPSRDRIPENRRTESPERETADQPSEQKVSAVKPAAEPLSIRSAANLGLLLRERRKALGFNQQQLADLSGVGRRFVSELEAGKPTLEFDRVLQCCKALGLDFFVKARS